MMDDQTVFKINMKFQITQEDFDKAISAKKAKELPSQTCLVTQALKRVFSSSLVGTSYGSATIDNKTYSLCIGISTLISQFDANRINPNIFPVDCEVKDRNIFKTRPNFPKIKHESF